MVVKLVLIRHGESEWNKKKLFTGWTDVDLSLHGIAETKECAKLLAKECLSFGVAFTSVMRRSLHSFDIIRATIKNSIPVHHSWRLNERHYGDLQGKSKPKIIEEFGEKQTLIWRRSWNIPPPPLTKKDKRYLEQIKTYPDAEQPLSESLKDCVSRVLPYWYENIIPELRKGRAVLIVAHGNSLRGIVKVLDNISDQDISELNIPTGVPLVYELDEKNSFRPIKHYYLGNQKEIAARIQAVKDQVKN